MSLESTHTPATAPPCTNCAAVMDPAHRFCPWCGRSAAGVDYRGPAIVGAIAAFFLLVGGGVALASFSTINSQGASGLLADALGPLVNDLLGGIGQDRIRLLDDGDGAGASLSVVIAFLVGSTVACAALFLLAGAGIWALVRWSPRHRAQDAYVRAQPALSTAKERATPTARRAADVSRTVARDEVAPRVAEGARKGRAAAQRALEQRREP